jgi:glutathione peroxidase
MAKSLYDFTMKSIQGKDVPLKSYRGKVLLIVNVASKCGLTPQYEKLEALHKKYSARGLRILGFPANNFGAQEPGSNAEILQFCKATYNVSFDMFAKISVRGGDIDPLYAHLTGLNKPLGGDIEWNFAKFLVDRKGNVVERFPATLSPDDPKLVAVLEKLLAHTR